MDSTLVGRLRLRKQALIERLNSYGMPQYQRYLYIVTTTLNQTTKTSTRAYTLINPNPKIYNVPTKMIGLPLSDGTITLAADDIICDHISRQYHDDDAYFEDESVKDYSRDLFTANINHFVIADELAESPAAPTGIRCKLIHLSDNGALSWRLILRKLNDRDQR